MLSDQWSDKLQHLMERVSTARGFSLNDIEELLNSELETSQLLEYLTAVMSNRMN